MDADWDKELKRWLEPFVEALGHRTRRRMCPAYVAGLIGPGDRKSVQPMAARHSGVSYDQLHHFIGSSVWDAAPLEATLLIDADKLVGGDDAWLIIDDTALPKRASLVCVAPQYAPPWEDCQLSVSGLGDAGIARGAGDGGSAAISARGLDGESQAHDASPCAEGSTNRSDKTGDCD